MQNKFYDKDEPKTLDLQYFRDSGLLQEVNRQFFHPRGLALAVTLDENDNNKVVGIGPIIDSRDDIEGHCFDKIDQDKVKNVKKMTRKFSKRRRELFGNIVQKQDYPVEQS